MGSGVIPSFLSEDVCFFGLFACSFSIIVGSCSCFVVLPLCGPDPVGLTG
jgi:hypothetical protein